MAQQVGDLSETPCARQNPENPDLERTKPYVAISTPVDAQTMQLPVPMLISAPDATEADMSNQHAQSIEERYWIKDSSKAASRIEGLSNHPVRSFFRSDEESTPRLTLTKQSQSHPPSVYYPLLPRKTQSLITLPIFPFVHLSISPALSIFLLTTSITRLLTPW